MYDYEDFYNEPSEFEQQLYELKQSLLKSIKDEHNAEIDRLRKENEELLPIKARINEIEREHIREKQALDRAKEDAFKEAKKMRFTELLKDYQRVIYTIDDRRILGPKCDKCADDRTVEYTTPLRRKAKEDCSCKTYKTEYELREVTASAIEHYSPKNGIHVEYYDEQREERVRSHYMFKDGSAYESVTVWTYFADKAEAQKYCDWVTAKEETK